MLAERGKPESGCQGPSFGFLVKDEGENHSDGRPPNAEPPPPE